MAEVYYDLDIKLNKSEMPKFKKKFGELFKSKIGPDMHEAIRRIILYKKLRPGQNKSIPEFLVSHAGLFPAAILDNMKRKHINYGPGTESGISLQSMPNGTEVVIKVELSDTAKAEFVDYSPEAVMKMVTGLDPSVAKSIFRTAVDKAGMD